MRESEMIRALNDAAPEAGLPQLTGNVAWLVAEVVWWMAASERDGSKIRRLPDIHNGLPALWLHPRALYERLNVIFGECSSVKAAHGRKKDMLHSERGAAWLFISDYQYRGAKLIGLTEGAYSVIRFAGEQSKSMENLAEKLSVKRKGSVVNNPDGRDYSLPAGGINPTGWDDPTYTTSNSIKGTSSKQDAGKKKFINNEGSRPAVDQGNETGSAEWDGSPEELRAAMASAVADWSRNAGHEAQADAVAEALAWEFAQDVAGLLTQHPGWGARPAATIAAWAITKPHRIERMAQVARAKGRRKRDYTSLDEMGEIYGW